MGTPGRRRRPAAAVGLDIGSTAVRAAQIVIDRRGTTLRHFGQVGLPEGAVKDGEIVDPDAVVTALRRLWSEGGFTSRNVVLALSGQRVIVRQAEVVAMPEGDLRSALRYQAMDLIPIPVSDALLDFVILPATERPPARADRMQILLAAAPRSLVDGHLGVLRSASLRPVAVDPAPMASIRGLGRAAAGVDGVDGTVALVDIGSDLTSFTVREAGYVRFSRTLDIGGGYLTDALAERLTVGRADAESLKRSARAGSSGASLLSAEIDPITSQVEGTLSFFTGQLDRAPSGLLLTGGVSRSADVTARLAARLPTPVIVLDALQGLRCPAFDTDPERRAAASSVALLAVGAAGWVLDDPSRRLSLLPPEIAQASAARRRSAAAVAAVAAVAVALAVVSTHQAHEVAAAGRQVGALSAADAAVQRSVLELTPVAQYASAVRQRLAVLRADGVGNVDWVTLLDEITAAMPPHTHLTDLTLSGPQGTASGTSSTSTSTAGSSAIGSSTTASAASRRGTVGTSAAGTTAAGTTAAGTTAAGTTAAATTAAGASGAGSTASASLGSVSMTVTGTGTEAQVAAWLRRLSTVPGLDEVWVPSATDAQGVVTFSSSGVVTGDAPLVRRPSLTGAAP